MMITEAQIPEGLELKSAFEKDGSYGVPIYSFINDSCDMTITPSKP